MAHAPHPNSSLDFEQLVAIEKLQHMHVYSKSSTIATVLAPLLCIPLYMDSTAPMPFKLWFLAMTLAVVVRYGLLRTIRPDLDTRHNLLMLNAAIGMVTLVWGVGWFVFVQPADMVSYLLYQIISLTVLFVGMVGYCVDWKTFFSFVIPLKLPELVFIVLHHQVIVWPIALGSMVAFYLALKMGFLFARSWEKSFSLRIRNDALFEQLIEEKNASMAANKAKSEFIGTASHDLRQPMQAINIFIEMIDPGELTDKHSSIFLRIRKSVSVLNRMFNTLLDISKLDSNFTVNERLFTPQEIITGLEDSFVDICHEKGIVLSCQHDDFTIRGDATLIEQILRNLLSNAIQYTDRGRITVSMTERSGCLYLSIEDSGCGIPAEDIPLIFKEFYRSEHSRSQHDGLGLGLSIVSRIVKKIGGECLVHSEVGRGSVFSVQTRFPTLKKAPNVAAKTMCMGLGTEEIIHRHVQTAKANLGIIENDEALQGAYHQYFADAGYAVHMIPYKKESFEQHLASMPRPDFILSDFRLEEHDGIYFIQKLREEFNHDIPACIVTADTSPQRLELFSQNNIDVMYKPIEVKAIGLFIQKKLHAHATLAAQHSD